MAVRDLTINIQGDATKLEREIRKAQKATSGLEKTLNDAEAAVARRTSERHAAMEKVGKASMVAGAAMAAGLALATRAAVQWETAWAGVTKTVDGTAGEMAALEGELRNLARTLPASHTEIAAVAEAAGQLGIKRDAVVGFTKVMIDLGNTTNLTADEAATALARISNIMGVSSKDVSRMGATIVELGNNAATTEAEIVELATRLAAAGRQAGLSTADVFSFASTLTSVGVEAEAGGTAMSKFMTSVADATRNGGRDLEIYAALAGESAEAFVQGFGRDAAGAMVKVVNGLGEMTRSGQSTTKVFDDLGLADQRLMRALLSTASAGSLLNDQLRMGRDAWQENTALVEEANKRYETTAAKMQVAKNNLNDFAIDVGNVMLPALGATADALSDLGRFLGGLPGPVQTALTVIAGFSSVLLLTGGAALVLVPKIHQTRLALEGLGISAARTSAIMRTLATTMKGGAIAAAIVGVALAVDQLVNALAKDAPGVNALTDSLLDFAQSGKVTGEAAKIMGDDLSRLAKKIEVANKTKYLDPVMGGPQKIQQARNELEALDRAFAGLAESGNDEVVVRALRDAGLSAEQTADAFPQYTEAVRGAAAESKAAQQPIEGVGGVMYATKEEADAAAKAVKDFADVVASFVSPLGAYQNALEAAQEREREGGEKTAAAHNKAVDAKIKATQRDYEARIDAARKTEGITDEAIQRLEDERDATVEALGEQKKSWEDYADAVTVSVAQYLAELEKQVKAQRDWQTNMVLLAGRVSEETLAELAEMKEEGAPLVAELVNASDEEMAKLEELFRARSKDATEAFALVMRDAKPVLERIARTQGEGVSRELAAALAAGEVTVAQIMQRYGWTIENGVVVPANRANTNVRQLDNALRNLPRETNVSLVVTERRIAGENSYGGLLRASGGYVAGPGTSTSDSIPARLSNGEYVQRAAAVRHYGRDFMESVNSLTFPRGFAGGGYVSATPVPFSPAATAAAGPVDNSVHLVVQGSLTRESARDVLFEARDEQFRRGL